MIVAELIEHLKTFPPDMRVVTRYGGDNEDVVDVEPDFIEVIQVHHKKEFRCHGWMKNLPTTCVCGSCRELEEVFDANEHRGRDPFEAVEI